MDKSRLKEQVRKSFNKIAKEDQGIYDPWYIRPLKEKELMETLRMIKLNKASRILDAGCGPGRYIARLASDQIRVVGIDFSINMIKLARYQNKGKDQYCDFIVADLEHIPLRDGCFDTVICVDTLHHLPKDSRRRAIMELGRVLKKEGELIIDVKNKLNPTFWFGYSRRNVAGFAEAYMINEIKDIAKKLGLKLVKAKSIVIPVLSPLIIVKFRKSNLP